MLYVDDESVRKHFQTPTAVAQCASGFQQQIIVRILYKEMEKWSFWLC